MKELVLHGCKINCEEEARDVLLYVEDKLELDEFETLFDHAKFHDKAYFQDRDGHHYLIEYKGGEYFILEK
ncbi:MAG: hypothetical protein ACD_15C00166G0002 [uncultured bacterium]|nr:MAG: hypothetical protein ACD_15C00166G0002 [uncultured bacterium]